MRSPTSKKIILHKNNAWYISTCDEVASWFTVITTVIINRSFYCLYKRLKISQLPEFIRKAYDVVVGGFLEVLDTCPQDLVGTWTVSSCSAVGQERPQGGAAASGQGRPVSVV